GWPVRLHMRTNWGSTEDKALERVEAAALGNRQVRGSNVSLSCRWTEPKHVKLRSVGSQYPSRYWNVLVTVDSFTASSITIRSTTCTATVRRVLQGVPAIRSAKA